MPAFIPPSGSALFNPRLRPSNSIVSRHSYPTFILGPLSCSSRSYHARATTSSVLSPVDYGACSETNTEILTMECFWKLADESKVSAQYEADGCISFLRDASIEEIRSICLQYRYFVDRYPANLARLISKMPNVQLKSLLSRILAEELGSGKIKNAHIFWYDRFLRSIGVTDEELKHGIYEENEDILLEIENRCHKKPFEHVVGMVGMGGECLCQIYLTVMHKYLLMNKNIQEKNGEIDWLFWNFHVGEEDIEHRRLVREALEGLNLENEGVAELASGYSFGKGTWDKFWRNNYKNTSFATV